MIASEAFPYAKTGGLGDVLAALPPALAAMGYQVGVVLPLYRESPVPAPSSGPRPAGERETLFQSLELQMGPAAYRLRVLRARRGGVEWYFIDYPKFFDREGIYGDSAGDYPDNALRFGLLSRAALEIAKLDFHPQVLHCHDWQGAIAAVMLKTTCAGDPALGALPVLLTIHNVGYQGAFPRSALAELGLPEELCRPGALEFHEKVNFLKGGLICSGLLNTVSQAYRREIQTPEYGHGLDGVLRSKSDRLRGVLNGVDYKQWNPLEDRWIAAPYSPADLRGKRECKRDLLAALGLPVARIPADNIPGDNIDRDNIDAPLVGMVSRLVEQKGFDLVIRAAEEIVSLGVTLTILGTGEAQYEEAARALAQRYPSRVAVRIAYDEALAHKIEAGADIFLMPSRYEPCGLNQMYSLKYGTVPVVRATGGLEDTVRQWDPATGRGTGFKFHEHSAAAMMRALREAVQTFSSQQTWRTIQRNGMAEDFSWERSAAGYAALYQELLSSSDTAAAKEN